jgi:hypothetical protein
MVCVCKFLPLAKSKFFCLSAGKPVCKTVYERKFLPLVNSKFETFPQVNPLAEWNVNIVADQNSKLSC